MPAQDATTSRATDRLRMNAAELAALVKGDLVGPPGLPLTGIAAIELGGPGDLTFIRGTSFARLWHASRCSAALVTAGIPVEGHDANTRALILVPDADTALAAVLARIDPGAHTPPRGVHPSAVVSPEARVAPTAAVGPGCTVAPHAVVGHGAVLIAGVYIGAHARVGAHCLLHPGVVLGDRCSIGQRCTVHPNAVVGADGFGFIPPTDDSPAVKIPQIGAVTVGDDCEIGAGATIDRAKFGDTAIGDRVKVDNLVHIAHNCVVGDDSILCGRTTLGGSVTIGKRAIIGGAVTIADQATVGDRARVAGGAIVIDAVPAGETYAGIPAMPARTALANHSAMRSLAEFMRRTDKAIARLTHARPPDEEKPAQPPPNGTGRPG